MGKKCFSLAPISSNPTLPKWFYVQRVGVISSTVHFCHAGRSAARVVGSLWVTADRKMAKMWTISCSGLLLLIATVRQDPTTVEVWRVQVQIMLFPQCLVRVVRFFAVSMLQSEKPLCRAWLLSGSSFRCIFQVAPGGLSVFSTKCCSGKITGLFPSRKTPCCFVTWWSFGRVFGMQFSESLLVVLCVCRSSDSNYLDQALACSPWKIGRVEHLLVCWVYHGKSSLLWASCRVSLPSGLCVHHALRSCGPLRFASLFRAVG